MTKTMTNRYDRGAEDIGNIVELEHVNLRVADQGLATLFYVSGLGLTRDPYMMTSIDNMWINVGRSQFHLPTGATAQLLRGRVGLVLPDHEALLMRLGNMRKALAGTRFDFVEHEDHLATTCPWGNTILCHDPGPRFGAMTLGMAHVEFDVPVGAAKGVAGFYDKVFATRATVEDKAAHVAAGMDQELVFRETARPAPAYDGHHIQVYVANFSGPHGRLAERDLVSEESNQHQYRFEHIVDPKSGRKLFQIEHEVRSLRHPLHARPLLNRNPRQTNRAYVPGRDGWVPEAAVAEMDDPRRAARERRFEEVTRRRAS